jgi:hypothetical protein
MLLQVKLLVVKDQLHYSLETLQQDFVNYDEHLNCKD